MLTLIHGENTFLSNKKLQDFKVNNSTIIFEADDFDFTKFSENTSAVSLFNDAAILIVKGILSKQKGKGSVLKDFEKLFVKNIPPQNVIFYEEKTIKTGTFFKLIQKQGEVFLFPAFNKRELKTWMKIEVEKENYSFEKEVIDILITYLGDDLWVLSSEIEKLKIASQKDRQIKVSDVKRLSKLNTSVSIFELVDSLGYRNEKASLTHLTQILRFGEQPTYILAMIIRQYRLLLQIVDLIERGKNREEIITKMHLIPFMAGKLVSQSKKYRLSELIKIYEKLLEIDAGIKKGEDPYLSLELLIADICS